MKKAQGISLNVIIIAAIALIVLVILVVIFSGRMNIFGKSISSCSSQGGVCNDKAVGGKLDNKWRKQYCESKDNWKNCKRYQMEEKGIVHPDNILPDGSIDEKLI